MLAGIILSNLLPYLDTIYNLPDLWRQNQYDCVSVDALAEVGKDRGEGWRDRKRANKKRSATDMKDASNSLMPSTLLLL